MKLLFKAALLVHRHLLILILTFGTLIGLTLSNQMEMFTLGVLSDTGADFFALFASKDEKGAQHDHVTWQEVEHKWQEMDPDQKGVVTKEEAESYLSKQRGHNPLKQVIFKIKKAFRVEKNLKAFMFLC